MSIINTTCNQHLVLEFWNECDHANLLYQTGWKQRVFIDSDIVKPSYNITEDGFEDGDGNFHPTFKREQKVYNVEWIVYEYLLDAIYTIPQHDHKWLYLKNGDSEEIQDIAIEHEWITPGVAKVTMTFRTRYILKTNCCNNLPIDCLQSTIDVVDVIDNYHSVEWAAPVSSGVNNGEIYLVEDYNTFPHQYFLAQWTTNNGWTTIPMAAGTVLTNLTDSATWYYDGVYAHQYPYIISLGVTLAGKIKVTGYSVTGTFVKVYYKKNADANYTLWPTIYRVNDLIAGAITITGLVSSTSYNVKIYSYNHNCNYGYSNVVTVTTT